MENTNSRGYINEYRRLNAAAIRTYNENFRNFWEGYTSKITAQPYISGRLEKSFHPF